MNNQKKFLNKFPYIMMLSAFSIPTWAASTPIEPLMIDIPAGSFIMGSAQGNANELPLHKVKIDNFRLGKYEVTVKEYAQFIAATGYKSPSEHGDKCMAWQKIAENSNDFEISFDKGTWDDNFIKQNSYHPVLCVSAEDAQAYVDWLAKKAGKKYRLPSESEWEYAARANTTSKFSFGNDVKQLCEYGNVFDQRGQMALRREYALEGRYAQCDDKAEFTTVIGMYKPNNFGLFDTLGNVSEFTADCEHKTYEGAPVDGSAWTTQCDSFGEAEKMQIHRGGSYGLWSAPERFRSARRAHIGPDLRTGLGSGFRIALDITGTESSELSIATQKFVKELVMAQKKESVRRAGLTDFPKKPTGLEISYNNNSGFYGLSWQKSSEPVSYSIYRSETISGKYVLLADDIKLTRFVDKTAHTRKHSYVVAASNRGKVSLYSAPVVSNDVVKHDLSIIQAEDFNAMHGVGIGSIAMEEDVGGGLNLTGAGGINEGNWTEYIIYVDKAGFYKLNYRIASADGSKGFELLFDNQVMSTHVIPATGGWRKWQTASSEKMYIESGRYKVRVKAIASGWKLNWFGFELI